MDRYLLWWCPDRHAYAVPRQGCDHHRYSACFNHLLATPNKRYLFPHTETGDSAFDFFKQVVTFHPIGKILAVQQWNISEHAGQWGLAFITFLYVDILDCKLHVTSTI